MKGNTKARVPFFNVFTLSTIPFRPLVLSPDSYSNGLLVSSQISHVSNITPALLQTHPRSSIEMRRNFFIAAVLVPLVCFLLFKFQDGDFILMIYEKIGQDPAVALRGKVVWITGASSGIGEYLAYELVKYGCKLVLSARRKAELERVRKNCAGKTVALRTCKLFSTCTLI